MPGGDGTGPIRYGRMTGWGLGSRGGWGRGMGRGGGGGGLGWRHQYRATGMPGWARCLWYPPERCKADPPLETEIEREQLQLEQLAVHLAGELDRVKRRLEELGTTGSKAV